jgi:multisubunit Na+/H+ antiporter MnhG subunit
MAITTFNRNPTAADLRTFGCLLVPFVAVFGAVVRLRTGSPAAALAIWVVGGLLAAVFLAVPPARRPIFLGWSGLTYPIGWVVSHAVLAVVFYLVITPIGVVLRRVSRDPLDRRLEPTRPSYWTERDGAPAVGRYFRQF